MIKKTLILAPFLCSLSCALTYEPLRSVDPFKGTSVSYVVYDITDQKIKDLYASLKDTVCGTNSSIRILTGTNINSDKSVGHSFGFIFQQAIPDEAANVIFDSVPEDGELILLLDGIPSQPAKVISSDVTKNKMSCTTKFGTTRFTVYNNVVSFDGNFSKSAFVSAEEVKYRVYTNGSGYTGTIPKDVRINLQRMLDEK